MRLLADFVEIFHAGEPRYPVCQGEFSLPDDRIPHYAPDIHRNAGGSPSHFDFEIPFQLQERSDFEFADADCLVERPELLGIPADLDEFRRQAFRPLGEFFRLFGRELASFFLVFLDLRLLFTVLNHPRIVHDSPVFGSDILLLLFIFHYRPFLFEEHFRRLFHWFGHFFEIGRFQGDDGLHALEGIRRSDFYPFRADGRTDGLLDFDFLGNDRAVSGVFDNDLLSDDYAVFGGSYVNFGIRGMYPGVRCPALDFDPCSSREDFAARNVFFDDHRSAVGDDGAVNALPDVDGISGYLDIFLDVAVFFEMFPFEFETARLAHARPFAVNDLLADGNRVALLVDIHVTVHAGSEENPSVHALDTGSGARYAREVEIFRRRRFDDGPADVFSRFSERTRNLFDKADVFRHLGKTVAEMPEVHPSSFEDGRSLVLVEPVAHFAGFRVLSVNRIRLSRDGFPPLFGFVGDERPDFGFEKTVPNALVPEMRDELVKIEIRPFAHGFFDRFPCLVDFFLLTLHVEGFEKVLRIRKIRRGLDDAVEGAPVFRNSDDVGGETEFRRTFCGFELIFPLRYPFGGMYEFEECGVIETEEIRPFQKNPVYELVKGSGVFFYESQIGVISVFFSEYEIRKQDFPFRKISEISKNPGRSHNGVIRGGFRPGYGVGRYRTHGRNSGNRAGRFGNGRGFGMVRGVHDFVWTAKILPNHSVPVNFPDLRISRNGEYVDKTHYEVIKS
ncbi:MAG: hypothetical protein QG650_296 [Patescibacteria group bacterium]|nr:hypothetical protein [Patescibacteria group bacterium]